MINLKHINRITLQNNYCLIKISGGNNKLKLPGTEIEINTDFNPEHHVDVVGTVAKLPKELVFFSRKDHLTTGCMMWGTDIEIKKGNRVYIDYLEVLGALGTFFNPTANYDNSRYVITPNGDLYVFVHYSRIYAKITFKGLVPLNGYVIVRAGGKHQKLVVPESIQKYNDTKRAFFEVLYAGKKNKYYVYGKTVDVDIKAGQWVYFNAKHRIQLEYDLHRQQADKMYLIQGKDIVAVRDEKQQLCSIREKNAPYVRNLNPLSIESTDSV